MRRAELHDQIEAPMRDEILSRLDEALKQLQSEDRVKAKSSNCDISAG
jgi:hypothetical protein